MAPDALRAKPLMGDGSGDGGQAHQRPSGDRGQQAGLAAGPLGLGDSPDLFTVVLRL
jgi:hypothetical protein